MVEVRFDRFDGQQNPDASMQAMFVTIRAEKQKVRLITQTHLEPLAQQVVIIVVRLGKTGVEVAEINFDGLFQSECTESTEVGLGIQNLKQTGLHEEAVFLRVVVMSVRLQILGQFNYHFCDVIKDQRTAHAGAAVELKCCCYPISHR